MHRTRSSLLAWGKPTDHGFTGQIVSEPDLAEFALVGVAGVLVTPPRSTDIPVT